MSSKYANQTQQITKEQLTCPYKYTQNKQHMLSSKRIPTKCPYANNSLMKETSQCPFMNRDEGTKIDAKTFICPICDTFLFDTHVLFPCKHALCSPCTKKLNGVCKM